MQTMPTTVPTARTRRGRTRLRRAGPAVALAGLALALASFGCAGAAGPADRPPAGVSQARQAGSTADQNSVHKGGTTPSGAAKQATGSFTAAFARCMRAHGVPNFPDPTGEPGQLGPDSGIDLTAPRFVAALTGPCRALAPPAWVDAGPGSLPGGDR